MVDYNKKISAKTEKEQRFYPDESEIYWQYVICSAVVTGLGLLLFMAMYVKGGNEILFLLFILSLVYVLYIGYFMWKSPKLYIDKSHTYLHVNCLGKREIIYLDNIKNYDYFTCYTNPLQYPFLCLCVQMFLCNERKIEFYAFMKGSQSVIEDKMSSLGISKKSS